MSVCACAHAWEEQSEVFFCIIAQSRNNVCYPFFCWALDFSPSRLLFNKKLPSNSNNWINTSINCNMQFKGLGGDWIMFCRFIILRWWILYCCKGTEEFLKRVLTAERSLSLSCNGTLALSLTPSPRIQK